MGDRLIGGVINLRFGEHSDKKKEETYRAIVRQAETAGASYFSAWTMGSYFVKHQGGPFQAAGYGRTPQEAIKHLESWLRIYNPQVTWRAEHIKYELQTKESKV